MIGTTPQKRHLSIRQCCLQFLRIAGHSEPNRWKLVDSPFPEIHANVSHTQGTTKASFDTAMLFAI
jgi:hypothetical protein